MVIAMIEELAVVVKIENRQIWVVSSQQSACSGCRQKASCTSHALGSVLRKKPVPVESSIQLKTGDTVAVAIDGNLLLRAALSLYLLPLIALFTGAGIADSLLADHAGYADLWIAGSALLSFLLSLWSIRKVQTRCARPPCPMPVVVKKI